MQALLAGWQCEVLAARDADEALRSWCATRTPDMLLLDYHLDGGAPACSLREQLGAAMPRLPCVIITADHGEDVRADCLGRGLPAAVQAAEAAGAEVGDGALPGGARRLGSPRRRCDVAVLRPATIDERLGSDSSSERSNTPAWVRLLHAEFLEHRAHVRLDRALLDAEFIGDLLVESAFGHADEHLELLRAERRRAWPRSRASRALGRRVRPRLRAVPAAAIPRSRAPRAGPRRRARSARLVM